MSVYRRSGLVSKPSGLFHEILKELKIIDLRPVSKIEYKLDPFHRSAKEVRDFSFFLSNPKITDTNFKCAFKTTIVSDRSPPEINCKLVDGTEVKFKAENLSVLEILEQFNQILQPLLQPPEAGIAPQKTKSQKRK